MMIGNILKKRVFYTFISLKERTSKRWKEIVVGYVLSNGHAVVTLSTYLDACQ